MVYAKHCVLVSKTNMRDIWRMVTLCSAYLHSLWCCFCSGLFVFLNVTVYILDYIQAQTDCLSDKYNAIHMLFCSYLYVAL